MDLIRHLSIKRKLTAISMITTIVALVFACAAFLIYDYSKFRDDQIEGLKALGDMVATGSTASISFGDEVAASEALAVLKNKPEIARAYIHQTTGHKFASYARPGVNAAGETLSLSRDQIVTWSRIAVSRPVLLNNDLIGSVYVEADRDAQYQRIRDVGAIMLPAFVGSLLLALYISSRLQGRISGPILQLARTAEIVSAEKNYSIRAVNESHDEIGRLIGGFNNMLEQIELRDGELREHRDHLEEQIAVRTAELLHAKAAARRANFSPT